MEEIRKATFQLGGDKATRSDRFNLSFHQKFWEVFKVDLLNISRDLFDGTLKSGPMDYSYICLVPKIEGAKTTNDFRPICLINGVQKIIFKVLATRLEGVMKEIISPSDATFLKGRIIPDSFVTASEIVNWCSKVGVESVEIKCDFEKNWDF